MIHGVPTAHQGHANDLEHKVHKSKLGSGNRGRENRGLCRLERIEMPSLNLK